MEFTTEQFAFVKTCTAKGIKLAHQNAFAQALNPDPKFDPVLPLETLEGHTLLEAAFIINAYETAYSHFQAYALTLRSLTSEARDFGCAPQHL